MRKFLFALLCILASSPATARWREARSAHFTIYSEARPDALREFATRLERFDAGLRLLRTLPARDDSPSNRLTIYLTENTGVISRLMGRSGSGVAGFYKGRAGSSMAMVPRTTGSEGFDNFDVWVVLLHEYGHHFMYRNYPAAYPVWFIEGYAEFGSTARFLPDGSIDYGLPAKHRTYAIDLSAAVPLRELLSGTIDQRTAYLGAAIYGRGWLLTHYLTFNQERAKQFGAYLSAINNGKPAKEAAATLGDVAPLNRELDDYSHSKMSYLRVPGHKLQIGKIDVRELSEGADAIMAVRMRSQYGVTDGQAQDLAESARKIGARYPDDPFVQTVVAEAELDAEMFEAAAAAADRALAAEPASVAAMVLRGRAEVEKLARDKSSDAAAWAAARRWLTRANRAEPGAPEPLFRYHESFTKQGVTPSANAVTGLLAALALAPEDDDLRFVVARQHMTDGKTAEARAALGPVAFRPHGGDDAKLAVKLLDTLDQKGAKEALALWAVEEAKKKEKGKKG